VYALYENSLGPLRKSMMRIGNRERPKKKAHNVRVQNCRNYITSRICCLSFAKGYLSTRSRNSLPALKWGTNFSGTGTSFPDFGLRPVRGGR
jgi:hypothetical protein